MAPKKASKTQETVRIDSLQAQYLRYISRLTGTPITAIVREAVEEWLDVSYASSVRDIETKRGLLTSTCSMDAKPAQENQAFKNMLRNLETLERPRLRHLAAKA